MTPHFFTGSAIKRPQVKTFGFESNKTSSFYPSLLDEIVYNYGGISDPTMTSQDVCAIVCLLDGLGQSKMDMVNYSINAIWMSESDVTAPPVFCCAAPWLLLIVLIHVSLLLLLAFRTITTANT